jgi:threonylcarbamoyladenosine tRNA methylthiotransferase MtaB
MSNLPLLHDHQTGRQRAVLKIQDGCDAHCTYCIIPKLRPNLWSKPVRDAVAEARRLVDTGHVELVLTGIFLGAYGQPTALRRRQPGARASSPGLGTPASSPAANGEKLSEHGSTPTPLAALVEALCTQVPGLRRLRLSSLEPGDLSADLLSVLRSHQQVVPHFHLPLQSGSDEILRRMNRQYRRDDFLKMVDAVQAAFDRPALTTDVIAGFPGETDAEFQQTGDLVERAGFIHVHAFHFSPRPGTAAARWKRDFIHGPIVNQRVEALRVLADRASLAFRQSFIGQDVELLVEHDRDDAAASGDRGLRHGRCERYFDVSFEDRAARPGDFVRVRVERATLTRTHGRCSAANA